MKLQEINETYMNFSEKCGDRAERLAWMFIGMTCAGLVSGHTYSEFLTCAALSVVFMLLGVLQSLWQTVTIWLFKQNVERVKRECEGTAAVQFVEPDGYPNYIGFGAWVFYLLKMVAIAAAVVHFVQRILL